MTYKITNLREKPFLKDKAAEWYHSKWGIAKAEYVESIEKSFNGDVAVPQWYVVMDGSEIIAGIGVIENDFHVRKELTPNVCAVYVEENYRNKGIAGEMLKFVCDEFKKKGIDTLYLITDHTSFYERYGWKFLCMVKEEGQQTLTRMYVHKG